MVEPSRKRPLDITIEESQRSPVANSAIVVKNWGEGRARLKIYGKPVAWGRDFR